MSRWSRPTLRIQVMAACVAVAVVPLAALAAIVYDHERNVLSDQALRDLEGVADLQEQRLQAARQGQRQMLMSWDSESILGQRAVRSLAVGSTDGVGLDDALRAEVAATPGLDQISICDRTGTVRFSSDSSLLGEVHDPSPASHDWIADPWWVTTDPDRSTQDFVTSMTIDGEPIGRIVLRGNLDEFRSIATDYRRLGDTGETSVAYLADDTIRFIAPLRFGSPTELPAVDPTAPLPIARAITGERAQFSDLEDYRGRDVFSVARPIADTNWAMVVKIDQSEALASIDDLRSILLAGVAIAAGAAIFASIWLSGRLTRPIVALTRTASEIAAGDRSVRAEQGKGSAEISRLAAAFDDMATSLDRQAMHDRLTGLPNRALLDFHLDQSLHRARRRGCGLAVLFCDLDGFKTVNDAKGHGAGDRLLIEISNRLREAVRPGDFVCRFGGDEFVIVTQGPMSPAQVDLLAHRILDVIAVPIELDGTEEFLSASIGIAFDTGDTTSEALVGNADAAMYAAKAGGKARVARFDSALRTTIERRHALEGVLRRAVALDEFEVHYQPIVDLDTGRTTSLEALVRWRRDGALVLPGDFLPVAAGSSLMVEIGRSVLARVCADFARLPADLGVCINLSARELAAPDLVDVLTSQIARHGIDTRRIHIEVTEDAVFDDLDNAVRTLEALRALGLRIAIDDFGTGYSSLTHLRAIPADILKIDQTFVAGIAGPTADPDDAQIVQLVVSLGAQLGLEVVAEGIECRSQLDMLRSMGCPKGQGYLFGRAAPLEVLETGLLARSLRRRDRPLMARPALVPVTERHLTSAAR